MNVLESPLPRTSCSAARTSKIDVTLSTPLLFAMLLLNPQKRTTGGNKASVDTVRLFQGRYLQHAEWDLCSRCRYGIGPCHTLCCTARTTPRAHPRERVSSTHSPKSDGMVFGVHLCFAARKPILGVHISLLPSDTRCSFQERQSREKMMKTQQALRSCPVQQPTARASICHGHRTG